MGKWLNEDFYDNAFNESEKTFIQTVEKDNITLLTAEEATTLMDIDERKIKTEWWLKDIYDLYEGCRGVNYVSMEGEVRTDRNRRGIWGHMAIEETKKDVRPTLTLVF